VKSARVKDFAFILVGLLTQHDQKVSARERSPNIYRLGHYLKAAQTAEDHAKRAEVWERDDKEAIDYYTAILRKHFIWEGGQFALVPLRQLDKQMIAWVTDGKPPKYGKLRANPAWMRVFG